MTAEIDIKFKLANAWQAKGDVERAVRGYKEVLAADPTYAAAYVHLGNLKLVERQEQEALVHFDKALECDPESTDLTYYYRTLGVEDRQTEAESKIPVDSERSELRNHTNGKIDIRDQRTFGFHRSGWRYAMNALMPLHNSDGALFDGFLERHFLWSHRPAITRTPRILEKMKQDGVFDLLADSEEKGITPFTRPWVGFLHNPQGMPIWFHYKDSPQSLIKKEIWNRSMPHCLGLFALSEYHAAWLRKHTGKPVSALIHPTEIPDRQFDMDRFMHNSEKKIVQIGWWLRKLSAIERLPIAAANEMNYSKIRLVPGFSSRAGQVVASLVKTEKRLYHITIENEYLENTKEYSQLLEHEYDELLSQNLAFLELYDSSANNAVIECIARTTPLLINPLPAVVEYLGDTYPFYYDDLADAAAKAQDVQRIKATHQYLKECPTRQKLSAEYFCESLANSEVYKSI